MKYLFVKMRRDLAKMWPQFLSVFLMAFLGILIYVGTEGTWFGMQTELNSYFQKTNLASAWVYGNGLTNGDLQKIKTTGGVSGGTLAMTLSAKVKLSGASGGKEPDLKLTSCADNAISKPMTVSGTKFSADSPGIFIDRDFAKANGIKAGDSIVISVGDVTKKLCVSGIVISPEYTYYTGSGTEAMPNHRQHGYAFIGSGTAKDIFEQTVALKMQDSFVPKVQNKIDDAYKTAREKADAKAEEIFSSTVSSQKNAAYLSAVKIADEKVEQAFNIAVNKKKQAAYSNAVKTADEKAAQLVNQKFKAMLPQVADFSKLPQYQEALSAAKEKAEAQAKTAVSAAFAAQQPKLDAQLAVAKTAAEQKARNAVDQKFLSMQSELSQQLSAAKQKAENIAKGKATTQICKKLKLTQSEFNALNRLTALPKISSLDSTGKAGISERFVALLIKLPDSILSQKVNGFSLSTLKKTPVDYNMIRIKQDARADTKVIEQKAQDILGDRYAGFADRDSLKSVSSPVQKTKQIEKMSIMFSIIFVLLALLTMQTTMTRLVDTQRTQIGTMKALGFKDSQIRLHYVWYGLTVGLLGGLTGLVIAPFTIAPALLNSQSAMYSLPEWPVRLTPVSFIMVLAVALCCTLATLFACRKGLVGMPAETMRGAAPKAGRKVLLERVPWLWKRFTFGWIWTIRDISRSKIRSVMGIIGVLGCMMLLIASFGMQYTDDTSPEYVNKQQYTYGSKAMLASTATQKNRDELYRVAGGGQWVEETSVEYKNPSADETGTLSVIGGGSYVHLKNADGSAEKLPESGVLITQRTAKILNLKKGGTITFRLFGKRKYVSAIVRGVAVTPSPQGIFISKSGWLKLGKSFTPTSLLTKGTSANSKIDGLSYIAEVTTRQSQYVSAVNNVKTFNFIFLLLKMAAILLDVVILYNLGILSFTERTREYATLKVLGFYQKEIRSFALRENLATTLAGWVVGIPVGLWFLKMYVGAVSSSSFDLTPQLTPLDFVLATVITVGCSICVNLFLSRKVRKIDMVGALKSVE